jgi:glycosyltransferase involved in cell wall biosynthesis
MKVLVLSNMGPSWKAPNYGVFIKNFCKRLETLNISYDWIYIKKSNNKIVKLLRYIAYFIKVFFVCLFGNYEYVYVHYLSLSSVPVLYASKLKKIRIIGNAHGSDLAPENDKQRKYDRYTREILKKSEKIVVPSEYFKNYLIQNYALELEQQKIFVYPSGGIDDNTFYILNNKERQDAYRHLNLSSEKKYIGYCGRIAQNKGIDTLLESFTLLKEKCNLEFIVVGSGEYVDTMKKKAEAFDVSSRIHFYPMMTQEQLREVYNLLEMFVFPTEREGESLGLVAIEAMACGAPVIASDFAAPKYYIENGYNGYKFKMGDSVDLSCKILMALQNEEHLKQMRKNAHDFADGFSTENTTNLLRDIFA